LASFSIFRLFLIWVVPLFTLGIKNKLLTTNAYYQLLPLIRKEAFKILFVLSVVQAYVLPSASGQITGLPGFKMVLTVFALGYFTLLGNSEPFGRSFVSLYFWHI
jgi:hypothetical protein